MTPSPHAAVASLLAGAMLLGACADTEPEPESLAESQGQRGVSHGTHGLFVTQQLDEYVKASDVIIVGKVTSKKERADQRDGEWKGTIWEDVSVQVEETIVGDPVDALTVRRRLESGRVHISGEIFKGDLKIGERYLMVLLPTKAGKYFHISGEQGIATLTGDAVQFPEGGILVGRLTTTLSELRTMAPN